VVNGAWACGGEVPGVRGGVCRRDLSSVGQRPDRGELLVLYEYKPKYINATNERNAD